MCGLRAWIVVALVLMASVPACTSDDDSGAQPTTVVTSTTSPAPNTTPTTGPTSSTALGNYETPGGQLVAVSPMNDNIGDLLDWSFTRFIEAALPEPTVRGIDFEVDDPLCDHAAGWAVSSGNGKEVDICLPLDEICHPVNGVVLTLPGKLCMLHELAHLWMAEHVDEAIRSDFIEHTGAHTWRDLNVPWRHRGIEQAADTIAWGLLGGTIEILGRPLPPCDLLHDGFVLLTGQPPLSTCSHFETGDAEG